MKILVIDDNVIHQDAAKAQLKDHETTVVGTYDAGQELLKVQHEFDAVLVDLLMPASRQQQGGAGMRFMGQEMPVGIFLALLAAKNGAKYVAVLTDVDHHSHPASACFDAFNREGENHPTPFTIEGAKVLLSNTRNWLKACYCEDLSKFMDWKDYFKDKEKAKQITVRAKDWRTLLNYIVAWPTGTP